MLRRLLKTAVALAVLATVLGFAWLAYGQYNTSEAVHFDQSVKVVHDQSENMSVAFGETGNFVDTEIAAVTDISRLIGEWTPRYNRAQTAYAIFDAAVVAAEARAEEYFMAQRALTGAYNDDVRRAQAQAEDEADYRLYLAWRDRAHSVRARAKEITNRLHDMNIDLQKLELAAGFSFDASGFSEVPSDILALDDELQQFQIASQNIRQITASPFEVK